VTDSCTEADNCYRYKTYVGIPFLTSELGFDSELDCCQFIAEHGGEGLLDDERASGGDIKFAAGRAGQIFEEQRQVAFRQTPK
jgi:hypothetical protein